MIVFGTLLLICVCGMLWGWSSRETSEGRGTQASRPAFHFWRSAGTVAIGALCLLAVPSIATRTIPDFKNVVARLHGDVLNARDLALQRRGYYEELDVGRQDMWEWHRAEDPDGWREGTKVFYRKRPDFLMQEIVPSVSTILNGVPAASNHWGMRDREYEKIKPANTYRMVLSGVSHDEGSGVRDHETYENVAEDRLNRERPDQQYSRYEILNLSVAGDCILQKLLRLEQVGFEYQPDAAMLSVSAVEREFLVRHLRKSVVFGIAPPGNYREILEPLIHKAGIHGRMPDGMIERRLQPYAAEIFDWVFRRFARQCAQHKIRPLVIYRPAPADFENVEPASRGEMVRLTRAAVVELIDLSQAFDSVTDRNTLMIAKWDQHTTALGHRLLADKLYEGLVPLLQRASTTILSAENQAERK
jgi:hypothetical protein